MSELYDLMLLLDADAPGERREQILAEVGQSISSAGEIVGRHDWGSRTMAYEIRHQTAADYHLIQFKGPTALLESLQHTLRITDGVVRFRIIKLHPGTPAPPEVRPEVRTPPPAAEEAPVEDAPAPAAVVPAEAAAPAVEAPETAVPAVEAPEPADEAAPPADEAPAAPEEPVVTAPESTPSAP